MKPFTIGTRGSDLALAQTRMVAVLLRKENSNVQIHEQVIQTTGDARLDISLSNPGPIDKGLFTKELERALLDRSIDLAVHSLKDLPIENPEGLVLGAILPREEPDDVLISKHPGGMKGLSPGACVATGSLRRRCFLLSERPDLEVVELRGNVPTRIKKLRDQHGLEAIVLAGAGIRRLSMAGCALGMDGFHQTALAFMLPAPGQGAVAVQCRADDHETLAVLQTIHDLPSAVAVTAERAVLAGLGGGCHTPVGVLATIAKDTIHLKAAWYYDPASDPATASVTKPLTEWTRAASDVIDQLYGQTK